MWTDPEHRGRGHARALLDALVGPAVAEGRAAVLHVNVANPGARAFYEGYGFVGTGELGAAAPGFGSADRADASRLTCSLVEPPRGTSGVSRPRTATGLDRLGRARPGSTSEAMAPRG